MPADDAANTLAYANVLNEFCRTQSEDALYRASLLSAALIHGGQGPDEIVAMHFDAIQVIVADEALSPVERVRILNDAHQFLLEVMIGYGAQYKEYLDLKLDEAVRRAESAEHSEREKLEILAMIAHELGNPLTIALGNVQIAVKYLDAQDMGNVRELMQDSRESLDRLAILTSQILTVSRGDNPQIEREPIDLVLVLTSVKPTGTRLAEAKKIDFSMSHPDHAYVDGDQEALVSIFNNLISNAVRYTPAEGSVTLRCYEQDGQVVVEVTDTGIGIGEEEQKHIFDKFYRAEEAKEMATGGLGLGLSIVQRLTEAHGGSIEVVSEPGKGSTFRVRLPATEEIKRGEQPNTQAQ